MNTAGDGGTGGDIGGGEGRVANRDAGVDSPGSMAEPRVTTPGGGGGGRGGRRTVAWEVSPKGVGGA